MHKCTVVWSATEYYIYTLSIYNLSIYPLYIEKINKLQPHLATCMKLKNTTFNRRSYSQQNTQVRFKLCEVQELAKQILLFEAIGTCGKTKKSKDRINV